MDANAQIPVSELQRFARLAAPFLHGAAASGLGSRAARDRPGAGLEFLDLRFYEAGDDIRHVDWRQSARRGRTVVRRFRDEAAADWFICADGSASVRLDETKWRMTVQLSSALAYTLLHAGHRVALLVFSDRVDGYLPLGRGAKHYAALLALLLGGDSARSADATRPAIRWPFSARALPAESATVRHSNLGQCRDFLTQNSNVFVLSDFLEADGMRADLRSIRSAVAAASALQVLASDELHIPASGVTMLQDVESGRSRSLLVTEQSSTNARLALLAHRESLRKDCAALGIRFATCNAGERWERVLLAHLNARL